MNPFQKLRYRDDSNERAKYDSLSDDEKTLLEQAGENRTPADLRKRSKPSLPMCFALALLLVSVSLNAVTWSRIRQDHHTTGPSVPAVALYDSPVVKDLGAPIFRPQPINGSFEDLTIYRQRPSQEVDDAWLALGTNFGSITVPIEDAGLYQLKPGMVQRVAEQGGGYMADLFVFHNLHCLNLIRQTSHWNYPYYSQYIGTEKAPGTAFEEFDGDEQLEMHFSHCLDMLRQEIMCNANTAIYGQWWVQKNGVTRPSKDFSYTAQCKNWDAVMGWYTENHINMDTTMVRRRPGDPVLDRDP